MKKAIGTIACGCDPDCEERIALEYRKDDGGSIRATGHTAPEAWLVEAGVGNFAAALEYARASWPGESWDLQMEES